MAELTLVTFNAHYGLRPPRAGVGPYDLFRVLDGLGAPDVLVLQEVWRPDGERSPVDDFAALHGYEQHDAVLTRVHHHGRFPGPDPEGDGTLGISVLTRWSGSVLGRPAVGPTVGDPIAERRVLHLSLTGDDVTVDLVAVHLTSRLPHGPPLQLRRLARLLPDADRPGLVVGDCNFWGPPVELLLPGWRRTVRGRTWPAHRPHSQIDHVLAKGAVEVLDAEVLPDVGSDHRPVRVHLRIDAH